MHPTLFAAKMSAVSTNFANSANWHQRTQLKIPNLTTDIQFANYFANSVAKLNQNHNNGDDYHKQA